MTRSRSVLFVPASRPERIAKALASGADRVVVDLEDAVSPDDKARARAALAAHLDAHPALSLGVRINGADSPWQADDLALVRRYPQLSWVMVPKAESAAELAALNCDRPLLPLIETARGLLNLAAIASAPGVRQLGYGGLDLGVDLGLTPDTDGARAQLDGVRLQLVLHSRAADLPPPLETVCPEFKDPAVVQHWARRARDMGFDGMLCIHPAQVNAAHQGFGFDPADQDWARRVLAGAAAHQGAAFQLDGAMVDAPVIRRAERILAASRK